VGRDRRLEAVIAMRGENHVGEFGGETTLMHGPPGERAVADEWATTPHESSWIVGWVRLAGAAWEEKGKKFQIFFNLFQNIELELKLGK
jgi:hypothetical protein